MKIQEVAIDKQVNEYGTAPNNSSNVRTAGGVPQAVGNLKARRQALAATQAKSQASAAAPAAPAAPADPSVSDTPGTTTTTTTPGSTRPVEKRGLMYNIGKGIVGAAGALGSTTAQQAQKRATDLEKAQDFRAGPTTTTTTTPGTTPAEKDQAPAAAPAQDPAHAVFKDPNAFQAEWDKFVAANQNYKLIADPKLLSVLKTMWMRSGGMKAESKKNKGKRV